MKALTRKDAEKIKFLSRIGLSLIAVITILLISFAPASAADGMQKTERKISKQINRMIEYPHSILNNSNDLVTLFFDIDKNGTISVHKVATNNGGLADYVESAVDGKVLENYPTESGKYKMVISFKTI